jgi:hypothetical protein
MLSIYKIMLFLTLKTIFISLLLIALVHYLYGFFKNTLTVPKVKDLVNKPAKRYDEMFDMINREKLQVSSNMQGTGQQMPIQMQMQGTGQQMQGTEQQSMQSELKNFLNELKKPKNTNVNANSNTNVNTNANSNTNVNANEINGNISSNFPAANESSFGSYTPF